MPNFLSAAELAALDRAIVEAGLITTSDGPRHERHVVKSERLFRWAWFLIDTAQFVDGTPRAITKGQAWSNASAWRKVERAYAAELDRVEKVRLEEQAREIRERAHRAATAHLPRPTGGTEGIEL